MTKVKDLVLYQVATDRDYKVGDKIIFGKELNVQGQRTFGTRFFEGDKSYHQLAFDYAESKKIFKDKDLIFKLSNALAEADFVIRELAVEEVRKENFPDFPSRLHCMFLTDKKENVLSGVKRFYQKGWGTHFQAVAVKLNGNVFYARSEHMHRDGSSYEKYKEHAFKYWSQDQNSTDPVKEILFEGEAEIIEILDEFKIEKNNDKMF